MKIGVLTLLITATLLLTLIFPALAAGPQPTTPPTPAAPAVAPVAPAAPVPAAHPQIHDALEAMRTAKHHLESAEHDFQGHRVKAIQHLDQAIREAEICESMK